MKVVTDTLTFLGQESADFHPRNYEDLYKYLHAKRLVDDKPIYVQDGWGTPYELIVEGDHAGIELRYIIRSAGQDRKMHTRDDIVVLATVKTIALAAPESRPTTVPARAEESQQGSAGVEELRSK